MKVTAFSDVHGSYHDINLPGGDLLIFSGDFSAQGNLKDITEFDSWLGQSNYKYKVMIAGNHDCSIERLGKHLSKGLIKNALYLEDESVSIEGVKIYGSPYQPEFCDWSFGLPRDGRELKEKRDLIPNDTDILITHNPPYGILDYVNIDGRNVSQGCKHLINTVVDRVRPLYHIFGHLHLSYGMFRGKNTTYINCSIMDEGYDVTRKPITFEI